MKSKGSFSSSAPSALFLITRRTSSCSMSSIAGIRHEPHLFQTGWFVESLMTQTLIIHIIRTNKIPFLQSKPSVPLDPHLDHGHDDRDVAATFGSGAVTRLHGIAVSVLANSPADASLLHCSHSSSENGFTPEELDLGEGERDEYLACNRRDRCCDG